MKGFGCWFLGVSAAGRRSVWRMESEGRAVKPVKRAAEGGALASAPFGAACGDSKDLRFAVEGVGDNFLC